MEIDLPSARRSLWRRQTPARRGHPCPREEKSEEKSGEKIEELISRPCVSKLPQAAAPEARSSCRTKLRRMRRRCRRTSFGPGAWMARLGRKSGVCMAVVFAVGAKGSHHQKPPPGPPRPPPSQCFPAHFCPELPGISRLLFIACLLTIAPLCGGLCAIVQYGGAVLLPLSKCPRTVSRSRSASRRAPLAAAPVALRAPWAAANTK